MINERAYRENSLNSTSAGKQPSQEILFEEQKVIPNKTFKRYFNQCCTETIKNSF